ncbi:c-type cytochrome, partial [Effusibacillus lacus]
MQEQENEKIEQLIREQLSEGIHKKVTKKPRRRKVAKEMIWAALLLAVVTLITLFRMESEPNSSVTFFDKWKNFILIGLVVINYLITWMLLSKKSPIQDVAVKRAVATVVALLTVVGIGSFAVMATLTPTEEAAVAGSGGNGNPAKAGGETGGKGMDVLSGKCLGCHTFKGKGGTMGPDLTDIKNRKDRESIRNYIKNPAGAMPKLNLPDEDLESVVALLTEGAKDGQAKPQG